MNGRTKASPLEGDDEFGQRQGDSGDEFLVEDFPDVVEGHEIIGDEVEGAGHVAAGGLKEGGGDIVFMDNLAFGGRGAAGLDKSRAVMDSTSAARERWSRRTRPR